jgi:lysyl-tRNA synthetase, class II
LPAGDLMAESENQYVELRRQKARELREQGINPFRNGIRPTHTAGDIHGAHGEKDAGALETLSETFSIAGRIMAIRAFGKAAFLQVQDRSGKIQVFIQKQSLRPEHFELYKKLDVGDFCAFTGRLFRTKTGELTIHVEDLTLVTKALRPLPEKWHGLTDVEARYRQRYVDLIVNEGVRRTFALRSRAIQAIREFFVGREFLEVETPMMHPIPGGAAAKPFVTHHNKLDMELFLRIAPELYLKRLVVGGLERVFEINRNFRNEGISIQHNPEFTMLEFYQSYATFEDLMSLTEELIASVARSTLGTTAISYQGTPIELAPPYARLTLKESLVAIGKVDPAILTSRERALAFAKNLGDELKSKDEGLGAILTEIFELTVEKKLIQPTFITHYPTEVSPLSRRNDTDPSVVDRFELFVYGREIANAFSELNDPEDQAKRFQDQVAALYRGDEEAMHYDEDYICALEYGMPPTAGEGVGIDRLVMLLADAPSIRDVILFPILKRKQAAPAAESEELESGAAPDPTPSAGGRAPR